MPQAARKREGVTDAAADTPRCEGVARCNTLRGDAAPRAFNFLPVWTLRHIALRSRLHNMMRVVAVVRVQVLE
jgi:hypothetical protein